VPPGQQPPRPGPQDRVDGLRGWVHQLDEQLRRRSIIGLVLLILAIGGAGAAVYLAVTAKNDSASDKQIESLQARVNQVEQEASKASSDVSQDTQNVTKALNDLKTRVTRIETQIKTLQNQAAAQPRAGTGGAANPATPLPGTTAPTGPTGTKKNGGTTNPEWLPGTVDAWFVPAQAPGFCAKRVLYARLVRGYV
jgi:cell division protein FtsB